MFEPDAVPGKVYIQDDWTPITLQQAEAAWTTDINLPAYLASDTYAECAAWEFKSSYGREVSWDLVVMNPPLVPGHLALSVADTYE